MDELLDQLDQVADKGLCYVALFTALTIPDMCGALESADGKASGAKYKAWFDKWVAKDYTVGPERTPSLSGETCYAYRCGLLHQGRNMHEKLGYSRILFVEPGNGFVMHNNVINDALNIDIPSFVKGITGAARKWLAAETGNKPFEDNYALFMKRHKNGLPPYIGGVDVIS
ncbi:hypothetical protein [Pseudomonas fragi]|uniref:hypothetical protein n=1 Tax=Pseudomonas fragi TaxID=296 RepID=UPI000BA1DBA4|nr:hypothetical protein [Pseudomonas fragi]PAA25955.1 hypothetical protein CJU72_12055 [Pseudomonas fragi]